MQDRKLPSGIAVDFGGTKIAAARVTDGVVGPVIRAKTDGAASADQQIAAVCDLLNRVGLRAEDRIGVALTGRVDKEGVWYAVNTETLAGVGAVPVKAMLSDRLARDVTVENDATAAAIGEYIAGAGRGAGSFGFITVSTGVGGGFVLNGRPLRSAHGLAGHVGFTTSRIATKRCGSGRMQTVESIAGGRSIAALAVKSGHPVPDAKAVYEAHLAGQNWASGLIRQSAEAVAELCANLVSLLDPARIAIGGSIGLADGYLTMVREALAKEPVLFRTDLVPTELGPDSAFLGVLADL